MNLVLDQAIALSAARAQAVFADPAFYASLGSLPNISAPDVRSVSTGPDRVEMVLGYRFAGNISGPARRFLDPARISWSQHSVADLTALRTEVTMAPDAYQSLLSFRGWYRLDDDEPGHCVQHFEAELRVHVPLLGAVAERAIASGISDNLAATAKLVEAYAAGKR